MSEGPNGPATRAIVRTRDLMVGGIHSGAPSAIGNSIRKRDFAPSKQRPPQRSTSCELAVSLCQVKQGVGLGLAIGGQALLGLWPIVWGVECLSQ